VVALSAVFSERSLRYLLAHAIDPDLAAGLGVREEQDALIWPYGEFERRRPLDGDRTLQPNGRPLELWWPDGRPGMPDDHVLLCEGEPDALAALTALRSMNGASPISPPIVAALPGCGMPHARVVEELRGAGSVTICLDGDDAGRTAADRIVSGLTEAGVATSRIDPAEGRDLADMLCASEDGGATLPQLLADAEATGEQPTSEGPTIVSLEDFIAVEEPGADALLGDAQGALIPQGGDVMVYGDGGAGKTTLLFDLAFHLATGESWLEIPVARPARVLLIENEGPRALLRQKLQRKGAAWRADPPAGRISVFERPWGALTFAEQSWREQLATSVKEREVDVIIAGPLTRLGMNAAGTLQEVIAFMELVADVRRQSGRHLTVILVHHENKGGSVSGAWEGAGDTLLHVQAAGNGHTIVFIQKARWASAYHQKTLKLAWAGGEGFALEGDRDYVEEVRDLLTTQWLPVKEISRPVDEGGIGAGEKEVKAALDSREDLFEVRTGDAAKALGRSPNSRLWGLRSGPNAVNAEGAFQGGAEGVSASASALKDADTLCAPPTSTVESALSAKRRPDDEHASGVPSGDDGGGG